jgi:hypothetical protein
MTRNGTKRGKKKVVGRKQIQAAVVTSCSKSVQEKLEIVNGQFYENGVQGHWKNGLYFVTKVAD